MKIKTPLSLLSLKKFQGFQELCARNERTTKYIFLVINHNITHPIPSNSTEVDTGPRLDRWQNPIPLATENGQGMGVRLMQGELETFPQLHYSGSCELFLQFHQLPFQEIPFSGLNQVSVMCKLKTLSCIFLIFFNLQANTCIWLYIDVYYILNYR